MLFEDIGCDENLRFNFFIVNNNFGVVYDCGVCDMVNNLGWGWIGENGCEWLDNNFNVE